MGKYIVELPDIVDPRGNLSVVEGGRHVPFAIARVFWMHDVPGGESRGGHAHKECHQFLVAAAGEFEVVMDDGRRRWSVHLDKPSRGVHIPPGVWAAEQHFSAGAVCLVMASHHYDERDYIRDYDDFLKYKSVDE